MTQTTFMVSILMAVAMISGGPATAGDSASSVDLEGSTSVAVLTTTFDYSAVHPVMLDFGALLAEVGDCGTCFQGYTGGFCEPGEHDFWKPGSGVGPDRAYGEQTHDCDLGVCSVMHPDCSPEEQEELAATIVKLPSEVFDLLPPGFEEFAAGSQGTLTYNESRNAVQLLGCQGHVIASLPLGRTWRETIADP
jgi:hypothetical protein